MQAYKLIMLSFEPPTVSMVELYNCLDLQQIQLIRTITGRVNNNIIMQEEVIIWSIN